MEIVIFQIDNQKIAVPLSIVKKVILSVEITPLPNVQTPFLGIIDVHGKLVPVINLRQLLGLRAKELDLNDQFLICEGKVGKPFALWVDSVQQVSSYLDKDFLKADEVIKIDMINSIIRENRQIIFVLDIDKIVTHPLLHSIEEQ